MSYVDVSHAVLRILIYFLINLVACKSRVFPPKQILKKLVSNENSYTAVRRFASAISLSVSSLDVYSLLCYFFGIFNLHVWISRIYCRGKKESEGKRRKDLRKANQDDVNPGCDNSFRRRGRFEASHREHVVTSPSEFFMINPNSFRSSSIWNPWVITTNSIWKRVTLVCAIKTSEVFSFKIFLFCWSSKKN